MEKFAPYAYLIDAYQEGAFGGTGKVADWNLASKASHLGRIVLAGGVNPGNVEKALATVRPWCIPMLACRKRRVHGGRELPPGCPRRRT